MQDKITLPPRSYRSNIKCLRKNLMSARPSLKAREDVNNGVNVGATNKIIFCSRLNNDDWIIVGHDGVDFGSFEHMKKCSRFCTSGNDAGMFGCGAKVSGIPLVTNPDEMNCNFVSNIDGIFAGTSLTLNGLSATVNEMNPQMLKDFIEVMGDSLKKYNNYYITKVDPLIGDSLVNSDFNLTAAWLCGEEFNNTTLIYKNVIGKGKQVESLDMLNDYESHLHATKRTAITKETFINHFRDKTFIFDVNGLKLPCNGVEDLATEFSAKVSIYSFPGYITAGNRPMILNGTKKGECPPFTSSIPSFETEILLTNTGFENKKANERFSKQPVYLTPRGKTNDFISGLDISGTRINFGINDLKKYHPEILELNDKIVSFNPFFLVRIEIATTEEITLNNLNFLCDISEMFYALDEDRMDEFIRVVQEGMKIQCFDQLKELAKYVDYLIPKIKPLGLPPVTIPNEVDESRTLLALEDESDEKSAKMKPDSHKIIRLYKKTSKVPVTKDDLFGVCRETGSSCTHMEGNRFIIALKPCYEVKNGVEIPLEPSEYVTGNRSHYPKKKLFLAVNGVEWLIDQEVDLPMGISKGPRNIENFKTTKGKKSNENSTSDIYEAFGNPVAICRFIDSLLILNTDNSMIKQLTNFDHDKNKHDKDTWNKIYINMTVEAKSALDYLKERKLKWLDDFEDEHKPIYEKIEQDLVNKFVGKYLQSTKPKNFMEKNKAAAKEDLGDIAINPEDFAIQLQDNKSAA